jgi:hypothetical protein
LLVDVLGTTSQIDLSGWYASAGNHVQFDSADGLNLDGQIQNLVQAMASYAASNPGFTPRDGHQHA